MGQGLKFLNEIVIFLKFIFGLANSVEPDEMPHSCMGIRYAKLFEAAKSMFKS